MNLFNVLRRHPPRFVGHAWMHGRINDQCARWLSAMLHVPARPATHTRTPADTRDGRERRRKGKEEYTRRYTRHATKNTRNFATREECRECSCGSFARSLAWPFAPWHPDSNVRKPRANRIEAAEPKKIRSELARDGNLPNSTICVCSRGEKERGRKQEDPEEKPEFGSNGIREAQRRRTSLIPMIVIETPRLIPVPSRTPPRLIGLRRNWIAGPVAQSRVDDFSRNRWPRGKYPSRDWAGRKNLETHASCFINIYFINNL